MDTRDDLRGELVAILAVARELPPDTDEYLADRFLNRAHSLETPGSGDGKYGVKRQRQNPFLVASAWLGGFLALCVSGSMDMVYFGHDDGLVAVVYS